MGKQINVKSLTSFGLNPDGTVDMLVESTDDKCFYISGAYPTKSKNQNQEVTLSYKNKKLDKSIISKKQSNFLNFIKTI